MTLEQWLAEYDLSHRHPVNIRIHKVCVPLILFSVLGMLAALPLGPVNAGWLAAALGLAYYLKLSPRAALVMAAIVVPMLLIAGQMPHWGAPLLPVCAAIFALAWVGQFVGHKLEGKKPSFFRDVQFLLIGPLWTVRGML
ncbi:Mpo1-like protein [uncultured Aquitalea sp.]|nr:Mpo1-like protein [uncultured Aquitalea sp.]